MLNAGSQLTFSPCHKHPKGGWDKNNTVGKHAGSLLTQKIATDGERPTSQGAASCSCPRTLRRLTVEQLLQADAAMRWRWLC